MKNLPPFLFLCVLILTSCKTDTKTSIEESEKFDYRAYLLRNNDEVPTLKIKEYDNKEIKTALKKSLNTDCIDYLKFNSITKNGMISSLAMGYCNNRPTCNRGFGVTAIFTNQNQIVLDGQLLSKEDLKKLDITNYLNAFGRKDCYLSIIQDNNVNQEVVDEFLRFMITAYIRYAELLSENKFNQPLKALNIKQLNFLKEISTFNLHFVEEILPALPPPPPGQQNINDSKEVEIITNFE
ncbi:hypothetical protein [uncultured Nonlabens sp.]|uniref:hypothetical protein n=1 Tax=uncultured Nonlabens sp. TaxID=859306 RepID=UPI00261C26EF|nr:hypothetical protein [uncultured Nonlabens sp.]